MVESFIGLLVALAFIGYFHDRGEQRALFPDQQCGYCSLGIYFDWTLRLWIHENGQLQYQPAGRLVGHAALPRP